ncbi:MAG: hypothetical protein AAB693_00600 [Patescibacteria group bacterium]
MKLEKMELTKDGEKYKINYLYKDYSGCKKNLWFTTTQIQGDIVLLANAFVLGLLLISMKNNVDIDCGDTPISVGLHSNLENIQKKLIWLFPELKLSFIKITASLKNNNATFPIAKAMFFTGGVDSFYTLTNVKDITNLIYVLGLDIKTTDNNLKAQILPKIKEIASRSQVKLNVVETNLRELTEQEFYWEYMYGLALGSVANLFKSYSKVYISSSLDLVNQTSDGSHSELDYFYSNEVTMVENYGIDKNRMEKIQSIMNKNLIAGNYLRVCWKNVNNTYNCGVCEKCVRTKMELDAFGFLDKVETFPNKKILPYLKLIKIRSQVIAHYYIEIEKNLKGKVTEYSDELKVKIKEFTNSKTETKTVVNVFPGKKKNVLFIDFNGVISYNPFWITIKNSEHKFNKYFNDIEELIFKKNKDLVLNWMLGKLTTEEIHKRLGVELNIPDNEIAELQEIFIDECKNIDLSEKILNKLSELKQFYHLVLVTDNMDTFSRFTVPNNKQLTEIFDEIHDSYIRGKFKKTDDGELFKRVCANYNVPVEYGTLIDDSKNNCACFSKLGGRIYTPKSEEGVLNALNIIYIEAKNKWEWQY